MQINKNEKKKQHLINIVVNLTEDIAAFIKIIKGATPWRSQERSHMVPSLAWEVLHKQVIITETQ